MRLKLALTTFLLCSIFYSNAQTKIGVVKDSQGGAWATSEYSIDGADTLYMFSLRDTQNPLELRFGAFGFYGKGNYGYFKNIVDSKFGTNASFEIPMQTGTLQLEYSGEYLVMTWLEENKEPVISRKLTKKDCAILFKAI
jgi:hypothetical protein